MSEVLRYRGKTRGLQVLCCRSLCCQQMRGLRVLWCRSLCCLPRVRSLLALCCRTSCRPQQSHDLRCCSLTHSLHVLCWRSS
jgi:hypothetical protein